MSRPGPGRRRAASAADGITLHCSESDSAVLSEILGWTGDPELGRIVANLRSHQSRKAFLDTFAEALVARHLVRHGCELRFEVPTPNGRHCDFEVRRDGRVFYVHVKRVDSDRPPHNPARLVTVSSRLRVLENLPRPYIVQVRFHETLNDDDMHRLVEDAERFILHARVGDEMRSLDDSGRELGGVRIVAPHAGPHVSVSLGLPRGFVDQSPRFRRLMHRAHQQFMPKQANLIMIGSGHADDMREFDIALLGSHIERWDAFPPRGRRLAHGRASDGFWHGQRFADSRHAAWFIPQLIGGEINVKLWARRLPVPADPSLTQVIASALGTQP